MKRALLLLVTLAAACALLDEGGVPLGLRLPPLRILGGPSRHLPPLLRRQLAAQGITSSQTVAVNNARGGVY